MELNADGSANLVQWVTTVNGTPIENSKADIASHVTTLNIDASAISGSVKRISVYANGKESVSGALSYNGKEVMMPTTSTSAYAASGQSDVVSIIGSAKQCKVYLLPVALSQGVTVTVQTVDGKFYSQTFNDPISARTTRDIQVTNTTPSNKWMATIPGSTYFSFVSTPGAHDAATSSVSGLTASYSKCQGENIATLLTNGVRAFDLRPNYMNSRTITADNLYLYHGTSNTNVKYVDAIKTLADFVKDNPTEAVSVIMVKEKGSGSTDRSSEMWTIINACHNDYSPYMKVLDHSYYTLDDFRGKICYVNRTGTECTNTTRITNWPDDGNITDYSAAIGSTCFANIQDKYNTNGDAKVTEIENMLRMSSANTEKKNFYYNFCSSAYKVGGRTPGQYANTTNPVITGFLSDGNITGPTGYLYADFIGSSSNGGAELLSAIVEQNYRYVFNGMKCGDAEYNDNWDLSEGTNKGWIKAGNWTDDKGTAVSVSENYAGYWNLEQTDFSLTRSVALSAGTYRLTAYGLYRDGIIGSTRLVARYGDKMLGSTNVAPMTTISSVGGNDLQKAANSFVGQNYLNTVYFVLTEPAVVTVGFEGTHTGLKQWFVAGPMNLERIDRIADDTDVTSFITNPTVYNTNKGQCPKGWICHARTAGNGNYTTATGDTQIENWHGTPANARFDYYQTLMLPAGRYTLTADLLYNNGHTDEAGLYAYDVATNQRIATATVNNFDGNMHRVVLDFTTNGGDTNIGIINFKTMSGDWFAADNFTLRYVGTKDEVRSTATGKYGTICLPFAFNSVGAKVYSAEINDKEIVLTEEHSPMAGKPYIYMATEDTQTFSYSNGIVAFQPDPSTPLQGVFTPIAAPVDSYVMQTQNGRQAFYLVAEGAQPTIGAYRAYLIAPEGQSKAKYFGIALEDEDDATALKTIDALTSNKAVIYDIRGRKLNSLQRGVNIVNGVKVILRH